MMKNYVSILASRLYNLQNIEIVINFGRWLYKSVCFIQGNQSND